MIKLIMEKSEVNKMFNFKKRPVIVVEHEPAFTMSDIEAAMDRLAIKYNRMNKDLSGVEAIITCRTHGIDDFINELLGGVNIAAN